MRPTRKQLPQARREGERGDAAIELAIVMALFCPLALLGTSDLAEVSYYSIEVASAAHVGALYGMRSTTYASANSSIIAAAQAEASDFGTNLTVTPTVFYACANSISGTQYTTSSAATSACTGTGNHALEFLQVTATNVYAAPFHLPGLPTSYTLTGTSIMEVEE
jgi:Flp pilus assembly protein TadG